MFSQMIIRLNKLVNSITKNALILTLKDIQQKVQIFPKPNFYQTKKFAAYGY